MKILVGRGGGIKVKAVENILFGNNVSRNFGCLSYRENIVEIKPVNSCMTTPALLASQSRKRYVLCLVLKTISKYLLLRTKQNKQKTKTKTKHHGCENVTLIATDHGCMLAQGNINLRLRKKLRD